MSLQVRIQALLTAIGADIKQIKADIAAILVGIDGGTP